MAGPDPDLGSECGELRETVSAIVRGSVIETATETDVTETTVATIGEIETGEINPREIVMIDTRRGRLSVCRHCIM